MKIYIFGEYFETTIRKINVFLSNFDCFKLLNLWTMINIKVWNPNNSKLQFLEFLELFQRLGNGSTVGMRIITMR